MIIDYNVPKSWNELNLYQSSSILNLLHNKQLTEDVLQEIVSILFVDEDPLTETYSVIQKIKNYAYLLRQVAMKDLFPLIDFIKESNTLTNFPESVEATYKGVTKTFYGPANRLINLTIIEFVTVDKLFYRWFKDKNDLDLDRICTILYREASEGNLDDIREPFTMSRLSQRAYFIQQIPYPTKLAIGYAFMGSRDAIISKFPIIFPKQKNSSITPPPSKPKTYKGMAQMITSMATGETLPLGPLDSIEKTNVFKFYNVAQEIIIKNEKQKQLLKNK